MWSPATEAGEMNMRNLLIDAPGQAPMFMPAQYHQQRFQQRPSYQQILAAPMSYADLPNPTRMLNDSVGAGEKPALSYATLITRAIQAAPEKHVTLNGIYTWISSTFPFYKSAGAGWKVFRVLRLKLSS
jgi:hypothetical protein